jgi:hypothetical protein
MTAHPGPVRAAPSDASAEARPGRCTAQTGARPGQHPRWPANPLVKVAGLDGELGRLMALASGTIRAGGNSGRWSR